MKRKLLTKTEPIIPAEILETAKQSISPDRLKKPAKCSVCNAETMALASTEPLCWVCRRLKISAWRDSDQQIALQE